MQAAVYSVEFVVVIFQVGIGKVCKLEDSLMAAAGDQYQTVILYVEGEGSLTENTVGTSNLSRAIPGIIGVMGLSAIFKSPL